MSSFKLTRELKVCLKFDEAPIPVGRLGLNGRRIYFEYDRSFIGADSTWKRGRIKKTSDR